MSRFEALKKVMGMVPDQASQKALRESDPQKYQEYLGALDNAYGPKDARAGQMGLEKYKIKSKDGEINLDSKNTRGSGEMLDPDSMDMRLDMTPDQHNLPYQSPMYLQGLEVNPAMQGQGLGRKALTAMEQSARKNGADGITLNASPMGSFNAIRDESKLPDLVKFYEGNGYQKLKDEGSNVLMHKPINKVSDVPIMKRHKDAALDPRFGDSSDIMALNKPAAPQGMFGKTLHAIGAPQRYVSNKAAEAVGIKGDPNNSEATHQAIVERAAQKMGIPEDSTLGNAAKALGVAGMEMFADPLGFLPLGKLAKGAGIIGKAGKAEKIGEQSIKAFPKIKKMFQAGGVAFPAGSTAEAMKIQEALVNEGKILPQSPLMVVDKQ